MKLYELSAKIESILDGLQIDENGEIIGGEELDAVQEQFEKKIESCGCYIKGMYADVDAIDGEIARLKARKDAKVKHIAWLENYVKNAMQGVEMAKFETPTVKIKITKSKAVVITDESRLPAEYIRTKTVTEPNKALLKKALSNGSAVSGAHLEERTNLKTE